jgi:hypothetical protein
MKKTLLLAALAAFSLPAHANGPQPEAPTPAPPAVEQPAPEPSPEPEPRAEEDNWTCRDGLHRHENRTHLCVEKRKGSRASITDQTYRGTGKLGK